MSVMGTESNRTFAQRSVAIPARDHAYPTSYEVAGQRIEPNVVLAPMEGVTDLHFRRMIRSIGGAGLTYTEFIASSGLREGKGKMWALSSFDPDERPVALQIYGREPAVMAEAARILAARGASIIDINMGCPSKKVCKNSGGSALMREPALARALVREVRAAIDIPLTVKMRSGFDPALRNAPELAHICQEEGADGITIHWRTRADGYKGERQIDKIAETVDRVDIPVIGNGDIIDVASAARMFAETGCAGVMVGRGAMRDPWTLLHISQWLRGEAPVAPTNAQREAAILHYYRSVLESFSSDKGAVGRMKMLANQFTRDLAGGAALRAEIFTSKTGAEAIATVRRYFRELDPQTEAA